MNEDGFFNRKDPNLAVIHEKPEHRLMIMLKVQGYSHTEIAKFTDYTIAHVSQVLRQPWARERIVQELAKAGREVVMDLLQGAAVDSVFKIIELRDTATDEGVQLRASQDLLDRHLGKATQRVESHATVHHMSTTVKEVDAEIARVDAEIARLTMGNVTAQRSPESALISSTNPEKGENNASEATKGEGGLLGVDPKSSAREENLPEESQGSAEVAKRD